jgi:hypothetical protein
MRAKFSFSKDRIKLGLVLSGLMVMRDRLLMVAELLVGLVAVGLLLLLLLLLLSQFSLQLEVN